MMMMMKMMMVDDWCCGSFSGGIDQFQLGMFQVRGVGQFSGGGAGCFAFADLLMFCGCWCSVGLLAVPWVELQ